MDTTTHSLFCPKCGAERDSTTAICDFCDYDPAPAPSDDRDLEAFLTAQDARDLIADLDRRDQERADRAEARRLADRQAWGTRIRETCVLILLLAGALLIGVWLVTDTHAVDAHLSAAWGR